MSPSFVWQIPLALTLHYESSVPVADQSILKVSDVTSMQIKGGYAQLNVRIEEVSRNHRQQCFVVKVSPNCKESPLDQDVGPALSPRVAVFSKHSKKQRPEEEEVRPISSSSSSSSTAPPSSFFHPSTASVGQASFSAAAPCAKAFVGLVPIPHPPPLSIGNAPPRDYQAGQCATRLICCQRIKLALRMMFSLLSLLTYRLLQLWTGH